jgi:hypothetical protein
LKSLQNVAGVYGLAVPCEEVQFPGVVCSCWSFDRGRTSTSHITESIGAKRKMESSSDATEEGNVGLTGYGLQLTYDVPQGKHNDILVVGVCRRDDIVYHSQVNFVKNELA